MEEIDASFVFAGRQRRCFETETVPVIRCASCLTDVRTNLSGRVLFDELIVNEELHLHPPARIAIVNCPPGNRLRVCKIQPATQAWVRRREVEPRCYRSDQQGFGDGFADEQINQSRT